MAGHFLNDLRAGFDKHGGRPALAYRGRTWTYAALDAAARSSAGWLQSAGVLAGDRVARFTPAKPQFLIGNLAAMYAGGIPLPLNPRFTREEMRYFLTDSATRAVIVGSDEQPMIAELARELPAPPIVIADSLVLDPPAA